MENGTVKFYNSDKGFGFIKLDKESEIFFHKSEIVTKQIIKEGDIVRFEIASGKKGLMAIGVELLKS